MGPLERRSRVLPVVFACRRRRRRPPRRRANIKTLAPLQGDGAQCAPTAAGAGMRNQFRSLFASASASAREDFVNWRALDSWKTSANTRTGLKRRASREFMAEMSKKLGQRRVGHAAGWPGVFVPEEAAGRWYLRTLWAVFDLGLAGPAARRGANLFRANTGAQLKARRPGQILLARSRSLFQNGPGASVATEAQDNGRRIIWAPLSFNSIAGRPPAARRRAPR